MKQLKPSVFYARFDKEWRVMERYDSTKNMNYVQYPGENLARPDFSESSESLCL